MKLKIQKRSHISNALWPHVAGVYFIGQTRSKQLQKINRKVETRPLWGLGMRVGEGSSTSHKMPSGICFPYNKHSFFTLKTINYRQVVWSETCTTFTVLSKKYIKL